MSQPQQPSIVDQGTPRRDYRVMSIIAIILCWPLGLVALMKSIRARREYAAADPAARSSASAAKGWSIAAFIAAGILVILSAVLIAFGINALSKADPMPEAGTPPASTSKTEFCQQLVEVLDPITAVASDKDSTVGDVIKAIDAAEPAADSVDPPSEMNDDWDVVMDTFNQMNEKLKTVPATTNFAEYESSHPELDGSETMQESFDRISDYCTY
ncbi:hypothetical protein G7068_01060 [Leucobacter viscericola]|uniref:Uncharacterized protein n=1 Tax=Leucobacter viscericola TaxID=2714935 RepID=A0A6G7XC52_9MICO|nr:CD225/dispanin family protein [Leucobacter viscericola]QIK61951.1 hypothetical protein G7068_01060 [Leucobacter viscericola]